LFELIGGATHRGRTDGVSSACLAPHRRTDGFGLTSFDVSGFDLTGFDLAGFDLTGFDLTQYGLRQRL
jgi:hypothetical protein